MHPVESIVSVALIGFWFACVVLNPVLFVRREILKRAHAPSLIPFVGGLFGVVGILHFPMSSIHRWWWTAPLLDFGSLPWLLYVFTTVGTERRRMP